jgi:CheY-like chemotaxis protein
VTGDPATALRGVEVLLVDDDAAVREALAELLQEHGARVAVAAGAREALELLSRARPSVVITDVRMPGEDGFWLLREIRRQLHGGRLPVIAISAFADAETAAEVGFHELLTKPVSPGRLCAAVLRALAAGG